MMQNTAEKRTAIIDTDFEVLEELSPDGTTRPWNYNLRFLLAGIAFGILLIKSEVMSWYRIQEMFRLQSFHMYGVLGSAVITGIISIWVIKKLNIKTIDGQTIVVKKKQFHKGNIYGGLLFGFGWAITGACPGPLFAQLGTGVTVVAVTILSAIAGTWVYGLVREKLPH
jgi:hypothetical protein